jgi:hypothetical protein
MFRDELRNVGPAHEDATAFAVELLAPADSVALYVSWGETVEQIASRFDVPVSLVMFQKGSK